MSSRNIDTARAKGINYDRLNDKQKLFVGAYLGEAHMNATEAARIAGYESPSATGAKLLKKGVVAGYISKVQSDRMERTKVKGDEVVQFLAKVIRRNVKTMVDDEGVLKDISQLTDDDAMQIDGFEQEVSYDPDGNLKDIKTKVKLVSKVPAADMLAKVLGLYSPSKVQHEGTIQHVNWDDFLEPASGGRKPPNVIDADFVALTAEQLVEEEDDA